MDTKGQMEVYWVKRRKKNLEQCAGMGAAVGEAEK